jgi:hypothetical protein
MEPILNEENFTLYAIHHYQNAQCRGLGELEEDLNRFKYLKRLFYRYKENGELKERLILNHLIILYNVFGPEAATKMLFYKIDKDFYPQLKTFLVFLNFMPMEIISDRRIIESDIPLDENLVKVLRKI